MSHNFTESESEYSSSGAQGFFSPASDLSSNWRIPLYRTEQFSYGCLFKTSIPVVILGAALLSTYFLAASLPPIALTLLAVAAAILLAYGLYRGLDYAMTPTLKDGYEEDVEDLCRSPESCWDRFRNWQ